ncbi:MAG TPA: ABC transporter permease [Chloroflexota bacterium]|nr:ABC transporter permease [Chloroflexota bacterium]
MRALSAQTAMELRLMSRRGENLLVTLVIPLVLLLFFGSTSVFGTGSERPVDFLVPGILALAIMSTGMVSLGIATAYERHYGVLKRLGGSPLTRPQLIGAKIASVVVVEAGQAVLLLGVAVLAFGWRPLGAWAAPLGIAVLGTITFAGLGLLMAGGLRAEATLAGANGLYLIFALVGGMFLPVDLLPRALAGIAPYLPADALADLLRSSLEGGAVSGFSLAVLLAWTVGFVALAMRTFQWE